MQDGASSHTGEKSTRFLDSYLGKRRWIRERPPQSPDLNPLDFCIWSILKEKVADRRPGSLSDLKATVMQEAENLSAETTRKAVDQVPARLESLIARNGQAFGYASQKNNSA